MTRSATDRERAKADRHDALLREAARLFADRGFSGVSLEDLGAAVGVVSYCTCMPVSHWILPGLPLPATPCGRQGRGS